MFYDVSIYVRVGAGPSPVKRGGVHPVWLAHDQETYARDLLHGREVLCSDDIATILYQDYSYAYMLAFGLCYVIN